ncbi:MAG: hypothetical protein J6C40_00705 [Lentisphaeria bacterium]|nr:hypothetical protein [Lentisphaeria bacterium]
MDSDGLYGQGCWCGRQRRLVSSLAAPKAFCPTSPTCPTLPPPQPGAIALPSGRESAFYGVIW